MIEVNYLAILVAGVSAMVLGGIWYGPLFGKLWMEGQGWDLDDKEAIEKRKKSAGPAYAQMFVLALVQAWVMYLFVVNIPIMEFINGTFGGFSGAGVGITLGFLSWLGFVLPVKYGDKLWGGKKLKYVAVDLGYYLVLLIIMGIILASWR